MYFIYDTKTKVNRGFADTKEEAELLLKALEKALPDTYFEVTDSGYKNLVVVNFTVDDESWSKIN